MWIRRNADWVQDPSVSGFAVMNAALESITPEQCEGFIDGCGMYAWHEHPTARRQREEEEALAAIALLLVMD